MSDAQTASPTSQAGSTGDTSRKPWLRWVLIGCGGLLALIVLFVLALLLFVKQATAGPEEVVQTFLAEAAAGQLEAAHECFSAPLKEVQPYEQFAAGVNANQHLFDVADTSFTERSVDLQGAKLAGTLTLASGTEVACSFQLVRENEDWKLIAYNIGAGDD
jgi:hypothetical protein